MNSKLSKKQRKIIHVDMDAFYASVEALHDPSLRFKPFAVGGSPESRGVISTANYEARKYGVKSAMSSFKAMKLCPKLKIVAPDFSKYKEESNAIFDIFSRFTDKIEPLSLDEAFLDVTNSPHFWGSATLIAKEIRRLIYKERGLTASAGIAENKFLAKVASDWHKPNGQFVIKPSEVSFFIKGLPVGKIFGVGRVTREKLHSLGIKTCGDLQKTSLFTLIDIFGSRGKLLYDLSHGEDPREVESSRERKSLSVENTYKKDLPSLSACMKNLPNLYNDFSNRFEKIKNSCEIKSLFVKIKFHDFHVTTVERNLFRVPRLDNYITLFEEGYNRGNRPVRLLGLGVRLKDKSFQKQEYTQLEFSF